MLEEIMRVESADVRDTDHGLACIEIALANSSAGQSCIFSIDPEIAYKLLMLFHVKYLSKAAGEPVVVLRNEPWGSIQGLKSLPCDPLVEVMRQ